ncbi:MAG TPA: sulfite exporter TauE/SafE family protein [Candidatus Eremiobacteraceae bacterium]|nr:sulfite exporter TauE/SafE family protein [Candidatus Eremiobacteraceae bacterium]
MHWYEAVGLIALGFFAGGYGSMVGLGGGFILMPAFLLLHYDSKVAAGTSIFVVLLNAASGSVQYLRQRRVDIRSAIVFAIAGVPGAWLGAAIDQVIPQRVFLFVFAALLAWAAVRLLTTSKLSHAELSAEAHRDDEPRPGLVDDESRGIITRDFQDRQGVRHTYSFNLAEGVIISIGAGFIASALGIGGGIVQVPAMIYLFAFPPHVAIATSTLVIALTALFGTASHALYGDVAWMPALLVGVGAVIGAQIGARLAKRVPDKPLLQLLALAVIVTDAKLIWDALSL